MKKFKLVDESRISFENNIHYFEISIECSAIFKNCITRG